MRAGTTVRPRLGPLGSAHSSSPSRRTALMLVSLAYIYGRHEEVTGGGQRTFSRLHLRATPTRARLMRPHRAELPRRASPLALHRLFLSFFLPHLFFLAVARRRWWTVAGGGSTTHRGVSRIEDRSDSLPPCLLPRLACASLTGAARKLRASPCARMSSSFHHPTFG